MSDTHAQTANAQADVQTGKPHIPPGHVEAERPVKRLGGGQMKALSPILAGGAVVLVIVVAIAFMLA
jgi:hypothetical protein